MNGLRYWPQKGCPLLQVDWPWWPLLPKKTLQGPWIGGCGLREAWVEENSEDLVNFIPPKKGTNMDPANAGFQFLGSPNLPPPKLQTFQGPPSTLGKVTWIRGFIPLGERRNDGFWENSTQLLCQQGAVFYPRHPLSNACCPTATMTWCRTNTSCLWQRQITCRRWSQARGKTGSFRWKGWRLEMVAASFFFGGIWKKIGGRSISMIWHMILKDAICGWHIWTEKKRAERRKISQLFGSWATNLGVSRNRFRFWFNTFVFHSIS